MTSHIQADLAIIGGGAGGLSLAAGAVQLGARVVLIESGKMGGDCLNYGCVPSKSLLAAAKANYHLKTANYFGVQCMQHTLDFASVMAHVHRVIHHIEKHDSVERFESLGVHVIQGIGEFINEKTLRVGAHTIQAKRFIIATGSSPVVPDIPGLKKISYLTNETIFDLKQQPKHLIVIGGGPIGCEMAQAFSYLGTTVTLLTNQTLLPKEDQDCVEILRQTFKSLHIHCHEQVSVKSIEAGSKQEVIVCFEQQGSQQTITGSHLFIATGRQANIQSLNLKAAGIKHTKRGIIVDSKLRTNKKKIYAIGDVVADTYPFTHMANYHAGIVIKNILFRLPAKVDYHSVPWVTYTDPEIAHAGCSTYLSDNKTQIIEWPYVDNDRAQAESITAGKIKVIVDKKARILGVTIVGSQAGELLLPWIMAIKEKKTLRAFTDTIVPYPTLSEISKRVAGAYYTPALFAKKTRALVRFLLRFG